MIAAAIIVVYHIVLYVSWLKPLAKAYNTLTDDVHCLKEELDEANTLIQKIIKLPNIQNRIGGRIDLGDRDAIWLDEEGNVLPEP